MLNLSTAVRRLLPGLLALLALAPAASAQTYTWTGAGEAGRWSDAENWDTRTVPSAGPDTTVVINGVHTVNGPTGLVGELQLKGGATLTGTSFAVNRLVMLCGRVRFDELTVAAGGEVAGGVIEGRLTVGGTVVQRHPGGSDCSPTDGGMATPDTKVAAGGELLLLGVWRSSDGSWLSGLGCCTHATSSRVTVQSTGTLAGDKPYGVAVESAVVRVRGRLQGDVRLATARTTFESGPAAGGSGIRPSSSIYLSGGDALIAGHLLIHGGGMLRLGDATARLTGPGTIDGVPVPGKEAPRLELLAGELRGAVTTAAGVRVRKLGSTRTTLRAEAAVGARLVVLGPAELAGTGGIAIDALSSLDLRGATSVAAPGVTVVGLSCCREDQIPTLRIAGTATIADGATLTVADGRLALAGRTAGSGRLVLGHGRHLLVGGATLGNAATRLEDGATVQLPTGAVTVDSDVEQVDGDLFGAPVTGEGAGKARIAGDGAWLWRQGDVAGSVVMGIPLRIIGGAVAPRLIDRLAANGRTSIGGDLTLAEGSLLTLGGTATLVRASATAARDATVRVREGAVLRVGDVNRIGSTLDGARLDVQGALELDDRPLRLGDGEVTVDGVVRLQGGTLRAASVLTWRSGRLVGPGTVRGDVVAQGVARLAERGTLTVSGSWTSAPGSTLVLAATGFRRDRLDVAGDVELDGRLVLDGFRRPARRAFELVGGGAVTGRFDRVTGRPAGTRVWYAARAVRLARAG